MKLTVEDMAADRGGRRILSGISFTLEGGEALLLTGPNGAGKTTLLKVLAGFIAPAQGTIVLSGGDPEQTIAEQAHIVGHLNAIRSTLTVAENAEFWAGFLGGSPFQSVTHALEGFGISSLSNIPAGYLSAGQKRRLGLARLLLAKRPLWLLDEPTAALDDTSADIVTGLIDDHTAAGGLAVVATHAPLELARARELRLGGLPPS
jgi:heme exporter protein A